MGNKQGASSCGTLRDKHRPDTRAKNWSFHVMDGGRYPGMATRSNSKGDLLVGGSKGRSSLPHGAKCSPHREMSLTIPKVFKDKKSFGAQEISCKGVLHEYKCPTQPEMPCTVNHFVHDIKCHTHEISCTSKKENKCHAQQETYCERSNTFIEDKRPQLNHVLPKVAALTSNVHKFHTNFSGSRGMRRSARVTFDSHPDSRSYQHVRQDISNAGTFQKYCNRHDQYSKHPEQSSKHQDTVSAITPFPFAQLDRHYGMKEVDPWSTQLGCSQSSEDTGSQEDSWFRQSTESHRTENNLTDEYLWVGLSGKYHSFNDVTTKEDFEFGQSGKYQSFNDNVSLEELEFEQPDKCYSFNDNVSLEELEFEQPDKCYSFNDNVSLEELEFEQPDKCYSFNDNVSLEELEFEQPDKYQSFNDNVSLEELEFGQSGKYQSFNDNVSLEELEFGQSDKCHRFNDNNIIEDKLFGQLGESHISKDSMRCDATKQSSIKTDLSRETTNKSDDWPVVKREKNFAHTEIVGASPKWRTNMANWEVYLGSDYVFKSETGNDANINIVLENIDDYDFQDNEVEDSNVSCNELQVLQIRVGDTSSVLRCETQHDRAPPHIEEIRTGSDDSSTTPCLLPSDHPFTATSTSCGYLATRDTTQILPSITSTHARMENFLQATLQQDGEAGHVPHRRSRVSIIDMSAQDLSDDFMETFPRNVNIDLSPIPFLQRNLSPIPSGDVSPIPSGDVSPIPSAHINLPPNTYPQTDLPPLKFPHTDLSPIICLHTDPSPTKVPYLTDLSSSPILDSLFSTLALPSLTNSNIAKMSYPSPQHCENLPSVSLNYSPSIVRSAPSTIDSGSHSVGTVAIRTLSSFGDSLHVTCNGLGTTASLSKSRIQQGTQTNVDVSPSVLKNHRQQDCDHPTVNTSLSVNKDYRQTKTDYITTKTDYRTNEIDTALSNHRQQESDNPTVNTSLTVNKDHRQSTTDYRTTEIDTALSNHRQIKCDHRAIDTNTSMSKDHRQATCDHITIDTNTSMSKDHRHLELSQRTENTDRRSLHRLKLDFEKIRPRKRFSKTNIPSRLITPQELTISHTLDRDHNTGTQQETLNISSLPNNPLDNSEISESHSNANHRHEINSPTIIVNTVEDLDDGRHGLNLPLVTSQLSEYYGNKLSCSVQRTLNFDGNVSMTTSSLATTPTASDSGYGTGTSFTSFDQSGRASGACHDVASVNSFYRCDNCLDCGNNNGEAGDESLIVAAIISGEFVNIFEDNEWWKSGVEKDEDVQNIGEKLTFNPVTQEVDGRVKMDMASSVLSCTKAQSVDVPLNEEDDLSATETYAKEDTCLFSRFESWREINGNKIMEAVNSQGRKAESRVENEVENGMDNRVENNVENESEYQGEDYVENGAENRGKYCRLQKNIDFVQNEEYTQMKAVKFNETTTGTDFDMQRTACISEAFANINVKISVLDAGQYKSQSLALTNMGNDTKSTPEKFTCSSPTFNPRSPTGKYIWGNRNACSVGLCPQGEDNVEDMDTIDVLDGSSDSGVCDLSMQTPSDNEPLPEFDDATDSPTSESSQNCVIVSCVFHKEMVTKTLAPPSVAKECESACDVRETVATDSNNGHIFEPWLEVDKYRESLLEIFESNEDVSQSFPTRNAEDGISTNSMQGLFKEITASTKIVDGLERIRGSGSVVKETSLVYQTNNLASYGFTNISDILNGHLRTHSKANSLDRARYIRRSWSLSDMSRWQMNSCSSDRASINTKRCEYGASLSRELPLSMMGFDSSSKEGPYSLSSSAGNECHSSGDTTHSSESAPTKIVSSNTQNEQSLVVADLSHQLDIAKSSPSCGFNNHISVGCDLVPPDTPRSYSSLLKTRNYMGLLDTYLCYNSNGEEESNIGTGFEAEMAERIRSSAELETNVRDEIQSSKSAKEINTDEGFCVKIPEKSTPVEQQAKSSGRANKSVDGGEISTGEGICFDKSIASDFKTNICEEQSNLNVGFRVEIPNTLTVVELRDKSSCKIAMGMASVCIRRSYVGQGKDTEPQLRDVYSTVVKSSRSSPDIPALSTSPTHQKLLAYKRPSSLALPTSYSHRCSQNWLSTHHQTSVSPTRNIKDDHFHKEPTRSKIPVHYLNEMRPRCLERSQIIKTIDVPKETSHNLHNKASFAIPTSPMKHHRSTDILLDETRLRSNGRRSSQSHDKLWDSVAHSKNWNVPQQRRSLGSDQLRQYESYDFSGCSSTENQPGSYMITKNNGKSQTLTSCLSVCPVYVNSKTEIPSSFPSHTNLDSFNMPMSRASISLPPLHEDYHAQNIYSLSDRVTQASCGSFHLNQVSQSHQGAPNSATPKFRSSLRQKQVTELLNRRISSEYNIHSQNESYQSYCDPCSLGSAGNLYQRDHKFGWHKSSNRRVKPASQKAKHVSRPGKPSAISSNPDLDSSPRSFHVGHRAYNCDRSSSCGGTPLMMGDLQAKLLPQEQEHVQELPLMEVCPDCLRPFDTGKGRKLIDSCGHQRCFSCLFSSDLCPLCTTQERNSPPPPPPEVAQHDLNIRLGLLLGDQRLPCEIGVPGEADDLFSNQR